MDRVQQLMIKSRQNGVVIGIWPTNLFSTKHTKMSHVCKTRKAKHRLFCPETKVLRQNASFQQPRKQKTNNIAPLTSPLLTELHFIQENINAYGMATSTANAGRRPLRAQPVVDVAIPLIHTMNSKSIFRVFFRRFFGYSKQILAKILSQRKNLAELDRKIAELVQNLQGFCLILAQLAYFCKVFA